MSEPPISGRRPSAKSQFFFKFENVFDHYTIGEVIGTGNYAEVREGVNKKTGEKVAIKVVPQIPTCTDDILNEIDILARVNDHPHVIQLKEIYEKSGKMYIVMELVTGGELFDRIVERQCYSEPDARDLMYVLIETVSHMHSYGIVHRDLKPENILFANSSPDAPIKIADFGLAKLYQPMGETDILKTLCGTPGYVAPEVLQNRQGYTPQCDLWSLGVILYVLLCGYPPFQDENQTKLFRQIVHADYEFHSPWWDDISAEAKDMVKCLLVPDPNKRMTPQQALNHPWMKKETFHGASVNVSVLDNYMKALQKKKFKTMTNTLIFANALRQTA